MEFNTADIVKKKILTHLNLYEVYMYIVGLKMSL